jgi:nuclear pore complex protein Nup53
MAFQTPASAGSREQPPVSLLFTPATMKPTDGKTHSPALGRAQSLAAGPAFRMSPAFSGRDAATPSRRRSLTPASSAAKDTPPPPPADSIMDSPGLPGPSFATWMATTTADKGGVEDMATSPTPVVPPSGALATVAGAQAPGRSEGAAAARDLVAAGRALREYESTWVTVFGFSQADVPLVLREFGRCGDVIRYGRFDDGPHVNWMHIKYAVS